jgi:RimJ/RimL family protein N-acetyltransferase
VVTSYRPMSEHLETERLILRAWTPEDAPQHSALIGERGQDAPTVRRSRELIAIGQAKAATDGITLLVIQRRVEGDFIGYGGLIIGRSTLDEPEIGYELFKRAHGHGYATEAARALLDAATATGRRRVWATVRAWNAPSFRVLDKLGFHRDRIESMDDGKGDLAWLTRSLP